MSWDGDWTSVEVPHSVAFGNINTYVDWHLVPESRPVIAMPPLKKTVVDIPGGNGSVDLSEALTNYPVYEKRTGSLKFHVLNGYNWVDIYEEMAAALHGRQINMRLADDPEWYYLGRYEVTWISNNDGTWSDVEITYDLEPLKYNVNVESISFTANTSYKYFYPLSGKRSMPINPWLNITEYTGSAPVLNIDLQNPELDISYGENTMSMGSRVMDGIPLYNIILSNMDKSVNSSTSTPSEDRQIIRLRTSVNTVSGTINYRRAIL